MHLRLCAPMVAALLLAGPSAEAGSFAEQTEKARAAAEAGDPLEAYEALKEAEFIIWNSMGKISLRRVVLVTEEPPFFGAYSPRKNSRFRPGEPILLYAEPVGYTIVEKDGIYSYSLTADVTLFDTKGAVLGGQKDFGSWNFASRRPVTDFMMFFTYDFTGLAGGDYIIETIIRDRNSTKTATFSTPVFIVP